MATCLATKKNSLTGISWVCTRSRGHVGLHIARGIGGISLRRWRRF